WRDPVAEASGETALGAWLAGGFRWIVGTWSGPCGRRGIPRSTPNPHTWRDPMRKIRMELERLDVESFDTGAEAGNGGSVHGQWSQPGTCDGRVATCQFGGTCGPGCPTRVGCTGLDCVE